MESQDKHQDYLIRTTVGEGDWVDERDLCRFIEYLGGIRTQAGFAFPTQERRTVALELLGDKFGSRYVAPVD